MARTSADITIHRIDGTTLTVPITPEARRTWRLMREDNIRLRWDSATEYRAMVGDRVDDELFGPFYVTEAQDPSIDPSTGAYRHDIRFDREYVGWKNVLHMLVYDDNGSDARKETEWHLTDTLANQLSVVTRNLAVLGYSYTYSVDDVDEASRAIAMSFSGTSIYDALNAMADAWKCEWWVTYNSDYTAGVIHMGRMETSESRYTITLGDNAETINASKSEAEYANRIFAYGSTRNIPDTYRKTLVFTVTDTQTLAGVTVFRDSVRVIRKDMLKIGDTDSETKTVSLGTPVYEEDGGGRQYKAVMSDTVVLSRDTSFGIAGALSYDMVFTRFEISEELDRTWAWRLKVDDTVLGSGSGIFATHETVDGRATKSLREDISASATLAAGTHAVTLEIWTDYDEFALSSVTPNSWKLTLTPSGWSVDCPLVYNGNTYTVRFNPQSDSSASGFNWFSFPGGVPSGFGVGKTYTLPFSDGDSAGLLMLKVPVSYYTDNMGDSMRMVGQKRLMLPSPGYVQSSGAGVRRVVEKVVIFEEEYPKLDLTVADIQTGTYTDNTEWSDGSRSYGTLPKYTVKLKQSGADFPFRKDYLTTDPLSLVFTSGKLSGMTFGVNFNQADMTYTIAFNEDYGAKLPNGTLKPENGDSVVLTGWNTGAIQSLGLVSAAEQRLLADAEAYLSAVSEPSLSLSCAMMSDRMVSGGLLSEGRKVRVVRGNLTVDTRVIGYEYKLDIPEDTPVYECGETDAYSRLRALEKALRASTQSVSSSGNTVSGSSVSPGGVSATLNGSLSWVSGNVESFQPDTFDGNGDKTLTIPTEIGHLAGNNQLPRIGGTRETLEDGAKVVDLLDSSGNRILPSGSLDWFIPESYEEGGETRYRLKLNPKYVGMYAEGWVSSGGISDTSGGGGASYLSDLLDVDDNIDSTSNYGKYLYFDATLGKWTAKEASGTQVTEETVAGWGFTKNTGTVTQVKVGTTAYNPSDGVVSLPAYPTTLPASDVSAWAKASTKPSYSFSEITGTASASQIPTLSISKVSGLQSALDNKQPLDSDLTAIAALTGTSGLLRKTNGTWGLDTASYVTTSALNTALDGYLPLTGGTLTGNLFLTAGSSSIYIHGSGGSMLYGTVSTSATTGYTVIGQAFGNTYLRGQDDPAYRKYNSAGVYQEYTMWHAGNANLPSVDWTAKELTAATSLIIGTTTNAKASPMVWDEMNNAWHLQGNLYADGFISAGGVSSAGGGSSSYLRDLLDVDDDIDSTSNYGKYLYFDATLGKWTAREASGTQGTVTSVALDVPTGLSVSGSPVTSSGTIAISLASGYSIPTTAKQEQWSTAYGWGDHSQAGYAMASALSGYLPLTGGTLTGNLFLTSGAASIYVSGSGGSMLYGSTSTFGNIGQTVIGQALGNTYLRGQNNPVYRKYDSVGNFQEYQMWHEGNDGAGSGLDADLLDGHHNGDLYADGLRDYEHHEFGTRRTAGNFTYADAALHYYLATGSMTDSGRPGEDGYIMHLGWDNSRYDSQLWVAVSDGAASRAGVHMKVRHHNNGADDSSWGDWNSVAMLDSNVASATKLETARTIWGQNFDGTGNVNGAFFFNNGDGTLKIYDVISPTASLGKESVAIQTAIDQQNPETSGYPGAYEGRCLLLLQPRGGRVGIGTPNPSHKLDVNGSARIAGTLTSQAIKPSTTSTSQSTGYDLGASTAFWKNTYTRRIYLASGIYIYYDDQNNCIRTNAPIASDSWISAGGVSTT